MKIADWLYIVASGRSGFGLTDDYDCHVYLLDGGDACALIDAGCGRDTAAVIEQIEQTGVSLRRVRHILLTHAHADHAAGTTGLRERSGATVLASPEVARFVRDGDERAISLDVARTAGLYPADIAFPVCPIEREIDQGEVVEIGDLRVEVVATPGHAAGHLTYVVRRGGQVAAFTGDALFAGGRILLQHTWDCSVQESIRSVERLAALDVDQLFPGHGVFVLRDGRRDVDKAMQMVRRLLPPAQFA